MAEKGGKTSKYTNLEPNVAGALAYIIAPFTGILFYILEKDDKFVRFHAFQSILFGVASYLIWLIASSMLVVLIGFILVPLVSIGIFIYYALLMWKAYNNEMYELPFLGKIARQQTSK
jgi:uncharacterized membrane protein